MTGRTAAVLVVPQGTHRPEPLAKAVRAVHPAWELGAVWCGDPQLRPVLDGLDWLDPDPDPTGAAAELAIVAGPARVGEWRRTVRVTRALLAEGVDQVVLLWVGAVAVLSPIDTLLGDRAAPMTLVARAPNGLDGDDVPTEADLVDEGLYSTTVAAFGSTASAALTWLSANLDGRVDVGPLLGRVAQLFGAATCAEASIGAGRWRWDGEPALLDPAGLDWRTTRTLA